MLKCRQLLPKLVCAFIIPKPLKTGFHVSMPTFATSESRANVWPVKCINLKTLCGLCECPFLKVVLSLLLFKLYAGVLFWFLVLVCFWCPLSFSNSSYKRERSGHKLKQESTCADPEGDRGSGPHLENYKNIGFLSNTGPGPLKITKLQIQHSLLGHHRPASETPFKWRFADGPLMARL